MACLKAAFHKFDLKSVLSFTTDTNTGSEHVMKKLGMHFVGTVQHPSIENDPRFKHCVVYRIDR
jgi:RimJ/RimL family protein N-acetyltransferase